MGSTQDEDGTEARNGNGCEHPADLEVHVLFTGIPATLCALRTDAQLAQGLTARIRLLLVKAVPYPREIESPQRDLGFLRGQLHTLADSCSSETSSQPVETVAEILLCRNAWDALSKKLPANSVIVIGKRTRWWPRAEDRIAGKLRAAGHHVVRTSTASAPGLPQFGWRVPAHA